jgi:hypothetical protein
MIRFLPKWLACVCVWALMSVPQAVLACSACFGASDSDMAKGMNMGIFALLGVVVMVLGGIAAFFIYLARRSHSVPVSSQNVLGKEIS